MKLRELTSIEENPLAQQQEPATQAAGAVKAAAGKVAQKVGQGAKMAANKMGGKSGSGAAMAKGLDKLASGGALTGTLSKQIAPFAKQLSTILGDQTLRNKFMMLVKQAEKAGGAPAPAAEDSRTTPTRDKEDYMAKKKAIQDLQMDPNTDKDDDLKKEISRRLHKLKVDGAKKGYTSNEASEVDAVKQLAKIVSGATVNQEKPVSDLANEMRKLAGIEEAATAGATAAGNIAAVANPSMAYGQRPRDSKGLPKAPQKKKGDGTAVNALDMGGANLMGGAAVKR